MTAKIVRRVVQVLSRVPQRLDRRANFRMRLGSRGRIRVKRGRGSRLCVVRRRSRGAPRGTSMQEQNIAIATKLKNQCLMNFPPNPRVGSDAGIFARSTPEAQDLACKSRVEHADWLQMVYLLSTRNRAA